MNLTRPRLHGIEVVLRTSDHHRRELLQTFEELRASGADDASPLACDLYEDVTEANRFLWTEWWRLADEAEESMASARFRTLLGAIKVLGTLEVVRRVDQAADGALPAPGHAHRAPVQ